MTVQNKIHGETISQIIGDIPFRSLNLTSLTIRSSSTDSEIELEICGLLRKLPKLETVALPRAFLTNRIWNNFSTMPVLGNFKHGYNIDQVDGGPLPNAQQLLSSGELHTGPLNLSKMSLTTSFEIQ